MPGPTLSPESWKEEWSQLCDNLRAAFLNELYYECVAQSSSRWSKVLEFIIAAFAAGSAISGWELWQQSGGRTTWAFLAGVASVLSLAKPFLGLAARAELASGLVAGFRAIRLEFESVVGDIRVNRVVTEADREKRQGILDRANQLNLKDTEKQNDKLVRKCVTEVNRRYSPDELRVPEFQTKQEEPDGRETDEAAT